MGDSDDEYHRRQRDKFTRERNDYADRPRRDYDYERRGYQRNDYSNGSSLKRPVVRRDEYPSNAVKRSRIDASDTYDPVIKAASDEEPQVPQLMTFKKFLATQDDSITDEDAVAKYTEYKLEFKRQGIQKFFAAHKDEEWFLLKYHPDASAKRKAEQKQNVDRRFEIFHELYDKGRIRSLRIDFGNAEEIIRVMDTVVVKLEGGTEEDVAALEKEVIDDESVTELKIAKGDANETVINGDEVKKEETTTGSEQPKGDAAVGDSDEEKIKKSAGAGEITDEGADGRQKKKMLLHRTSSIFLRNVAPTITIEDVETTCKRFPGFLRVGLAEPIPEKKWYRRGWVTFRRDVNIKEICWNLNSVQIKECDVGAIINRDLARRVRSVNGITAHKQVAQNDLRQAAKLAAIYDKKAGLYQSENVEDKPRNFELDIVAQSLNPLLKNLTDFLIEEASAEEEELLGISSESGSDENQKVPFHRDNELIARLDPIILYLRIVHSIDFYNHGEYPNEDVMPNRCGMMHVRAAPPPPSQWGQDENGRTLVAQKFVNDFMGAFNGRLEAVLMSDTVIPEKEMESLGRKDPEKEVEAFITANCVELAKDKWLCPLSGKKFKGPEFIRKHLTTKHGDKLEQVRREAIFFNNYLADAKRPHDLEPKPQPAPAAAAQPVVVPVKEEKREREKFDNYEAERSRAAPSSSYSDRDRRAINDRDRGAPRYGSSYGNRGYERSNAPRYYDQGGRRDPREPVTYKDLDAPEEIF